MKGIDAKGVEQMSVDKVRRQEILDTATKLFATSGVRTSLQQIADSCGIQAGSLYHHFESKEAILVELVSAYRKELDQIADAALVDGPHASSSIEERIVGLASAVAHCGVRHRAAVLLTSHEPPSGAGDELATISAIDPGGSVRMALGKLLEEAKAERVLRGRPDTATLAELIWQEMMFIAIGVYHRVPSAQRVPELKCLILLHGLSAKGDVPPQRNPAIDAADAAIARWDKLPKDDEDDRTAHIRSMARAEFARRGFEQTTMRDIAEAAGVSTGSVYRIVDSKDELLVSIIRSFAATVTDGWSAVVGSRSSALEKLDALMWFNINVLNRFSEEHKVQVGWLRQSPPSKSNLDWGFPSQLRQVKSLLSEGSAKGSLRVRPVSEDVWARCVFSLLWIPPSIVDELGVRKALVLGRNTVLRGAAKRGAEKSNPTIAELTVPRRRSQSRV